MYRITLPSWTDKKTGKINPSMDFHARLVEVLLANSPQPKDIIYKYYGEMAPSRVFYPQKYDRLVFERNKDDYIIIPNTPSNWHLWEQIK